MSAYRIKPSQLSKVIAYQVGTMQGDLRSRISGEVSRLTTQFDNECPRPNELVRIINTLNNLNNVVIKFENRINPLKRAVNNLRRTLRTAIRVITVLKQIPLPTATGIRPSFSDFDVGGHLGAVPISITNKYADLLRLASETAASIEDDIAACDKILNEVNDRVEDIQGKLDTLKIPIDACSENSGLTAEELKALKTAREGLDKTGSPGTFTEVPFRSINGKDYKLSVENDPNSPSIAPKRFAVAKDNIGVTVLRGPSSFASSTQVLIKELKFRIDNQLP